MPKTFLYFFLVLMTLFFSGMTFSPPDEFRKVENKAFKVGEKLTFDVKYGFVTAGIATFSIPRNQKNFRKKCIPCYI